MALTKRQRQDTEGWIRARLEAGERFGFEEMGSMSGYSWTYRCWREWLEEGHYTPYGAIPPRMRSESGMLFSVAIPWDRTTGYAFEPGDEEWERARERFEAKVAEVGEIAATLRDEAKTGAA